MRDYKLDESSRNDDFQHFKEMKARERLSAEQDAEDPYASISYFSQD